VENLKLRDTKIRKQTKSNSIEKYSQGISAKLFTFALEDVFTELVGTSGNKKE